MSVDQFPLPVHGEARCDECDWTTRTDYPGRSYEAAYRHTEETGHSTEASTVNRVLYSRDKVG